MEVSTAVTFNYTTSIIGANDINLIVEDEDGRYGDASTTLAVKDKTYISNTYVDNAQYVGQLSERKLDADL